MVPAGEKEFVTHSPVDPDWSEHSKPSRAKKVIEGPMSIPIDEALAANKKPVVGAAAGASTLTLEKGKAYRVIASTPVHISLTQEADTATTSDVYVPANQYVTVVCTYWNFLNHIKATGAADGIIQAIEVE